MCFIVLFLVRFDRAFALVIAALCAKGETTILNAESIDRGYVAVEKALGALGADIERRSRDELNKRKRTTLRFRMRG